MLRDDLKQAQISAMKAGEKERLAAVRLILAKVKDRDILTPPDSERIFRSTAIAATGYS